MKAKFKEIKKFKSHVHPPVGNYAIDSDQTQDIRWDHCREQFAVKFNQNTKGFYFSHIAGKSLDIGEFVTKFELITELDEFSVFSKTHKDTVLWIEPSVFWLDCHIKRSLFTILIRCGMNYSVESDNFDDALFGNYKENFYIKETKSAVMRFMFGFTRFVGNLSIISPTATVIKHGWREEFLKADDYIVRERLVLPEGKKKEINIIGLESLWN